MLDKSLRDASARVLLAERVHKLTPESERRWGEMNGAAVLTHLADALRLAFKDGEVTTDDKNAKFASQRREWIHEWPWPEGRAQSPPEGFLTSPSNWEADRAALLELIDRYGSEEIEQLAGSHPLFGSMTPEDWDVLMYRHIDHHLRQFGV